MTTNNTLTAVDGIRVGHYTDVEALTGCTVVLCPEGTVGGVDQRGGAPGTRETDLLRPMHMVQRVDAILLSGGSAFGLASADGVMRYLREQDVGFPTRLGVKVPIVPAAILFDLDVGAAHVFPNAESGYAACSAATADPVERGSVGAGTGCRIGNLRGLDLATKGGIGSACVAVTDNLVVAALFAVNAAGDVLDDRGAILGGLRHPDGGFANSLELLRHMPTGSRPPGGENTVIGVVATNARLTKDEANKVAQMAHDGLARAVRPAHTMFDGDTIFALATGTVAGDVNVVGAFAAEVTANAIRDAVFTAETRGRVRSYKV